MGPVAADEGTENTHLGEDVRSYLGPFQARQRFRVPTGLEPGDYKIKARLETGLYRGDEQLAFRSIPVELSFEVIK